MFFAQEADAFRARHAGKMDVEEEDIDRIRGGREGEEELATDSTDLTD